MRIDLRMALALAAALAAIPAAACGLCVEDRVAAVYDQAVVDRAASHHQGVAFFSIEGNVATVANASGVIGKALERAAIAGTARVSLESATAAIAFDPARTTPAAIAASAGQTLAARGLAFQPLRVTGEDRVLREP